MSELPSSDRISIDRIKNIRINNIWLLMLFASGFYNTFRSTDDRWSGVEEGVSDVSDLLAEVLTEEVSRRIRQHLSFGYQAQRGVLDHVRGKIDFLRTEQGALLKLGRVACEYESFSINTIRNRFIHTALRKASILVSAKSTLDQKCLGLARMFSSAGVSTKEVSLKEIENERLGQSDIQDRRMLFVARLVLEMALFSREHGDKHTIDINVGDDKFWELFEQGIAGFYQKNITVKGWQVAVQKRIHWHAKTIGSENSGSRSKNLPSMRPDIVLTNENTGKQVVVDTKTSDVMSGKYESYSSHNLYQIYAYLRTQEETGALKKDASGLLLYPLRDKRVDEVFHVQGHSIRIATVDLGSDTQAIQKCLLDLVNIPMM